MGDCKHRVKYAVSEINGFFGGARHNLIWIRDHMYLKMGLMWDLLKGIEVLFLILNS